MKIVTIVGCRPQFIKAAVLSREFVNRGIEEVIIHTGQHYDKAMSQDFFDELDIPKPKVNLTINNVGSHNVMIGRMIEELDHHLGGENPDYVLVYGDTNSTLAGALAARKLGIKVIHVEAGLRDGDMNLPEEVNRILTDRISTLLFCPSSRAVDHLENEGYRRMNCGIHNVGDLMYDSVLYYRDRLFSVNHKDFVLCTIHREHNIQQLDKIVSFLNKVPNVILVAHPRTIKELNDKRIEVKCKLIAPVSYLAMLSLINASNMIITDSGGLQKEAYFLKKRCLVLNQTTGWSELVDNGCNVLVESLDETHLLEKFKEVMTQKVLFLDKYYGNGNAGELIVKQIIKEYGRSNSGTPAI